MKRPMSKATVLLFSDVDICGCKPKTSVSNEESMCSGDERTSCMVRAFRQVNWISIGAFWGVAVALSGCNGPRIAPQVNPSNIRSVKVGMTEQQVTAILGEPLRIRP